MKDKLLFGITVCFLFLCGMRKQRQTANNGIGATTPKGRMVNGVYIPAGYLTSDEFRSIAHKMLDDYYDLHGDI